MLKSVQLIVLGGVLLSMSTQARVIYGEDNRLEVDEATPFQQLLARSSATAVLREDLHRSYFRPGVVHMNQKTLGEWLQSGDKSKRAKNLFSAQARTGSKSGGARFCEGERFINQPNPGNCSGFLIAPDLMVTAGHCLETENFCADYEWVFDFKMNLSSNKAGLDMREEDIYRCKKVVSKSLIMAMGLDYALIQLDRNVKGRAPLNIRTDGQIKNFTSLFVIGSPSGLPQKVSGGGVVRKNTHPFFFSSNLDAFQGNSGSPVFNARTGLVEGILVRGEEDFKLNYEKMCVESNRCKDNECRGEDVSRMTSIPEIGIMDSLFGAVASKDLEKLQNVLKLSFWVDIYGKDRQSALIRAAQNFKSEIMLALIAKGADVNLQDVDGNGAIHYLAKTLNDDHEGVLLAMLAAGLDLDLKNAAGETALSIASKSGNLRGVKMLLDAGVDGLDKTNLVADKTN